MNSTILIACWKPAKNKFNPDPAKEIRFGQQTKDEMMVAYIDVLRDKP